MRWTPSTPPSPPAWTGSWAASSPPRPSRSSPAPDIKFAPFPGRVAGHPSALLGTIEEITAHAAELSKLEGVHGVDLLAYRHATVDPLELTAAVARVVDGPTIAAGSVVNEDQIRGLAEAGVWGFTIGAAIFDGKLPGEKDVVSQVRTALSYADAAAGARV